MFAFNHAAWCIEIKANATDLHVARVMCFANNLRRFWVESAPLAEALGLSSVLDEYVGAADMANTHDLQAKYGPAVGHRLEKSVVVVDERGVLAMVHCSQSEHSRALACCWRCATSALEVHFNMHQKEAWKASLAVLKHICNNKGLVFGGAVRDLVLRRSCARKFYNAVPSDKHHLYGDAAFRPEAPPLGSLDRLLLFRDIDACIEKEHVNALLQALRGDCIYSTLLFKCYAQYVDKSLPGKSFVLHRYLLEWGPSDWKAFFGKTLRSAKFCKGICNDLQRSSANLFAGCSMLLDLLVFSTGNLESKLPIGSKMDFLCNALFVNDSLLTPQAMPNLCLDISEILDQICQKRAVAYSPHQLADSPKRIAKMLQRGWVLEHGEAFVPLGAWNSPSAACQRCKAHGASITMMCCGAVLHGACCLDGYHCSACRAFASDGLLRFARVVDAELQSRSEKAFAAGQAEGALAAKSAVVEVDGSLSEEECDDSFEKISVASCLSF